MGTVEIGDTVRIHYEGRLEDGTVFDSSRDRGPLEFVAGGEELIKGVSLGVVGMSEGNKKELVVPPENGYGEPQPELVLDVPRSALPQEVAPEVGMTLNARNASGQSFAVLITEVKKDSVVVDANHPLAGKTLVFAVELLERVPAQPEQRQE